MDKWKDIKGYEGKYQVSDTGKVRALDYHRTGRVKELKLWKTPLGYLMAELWKDAKGKKYMVHRLVYQTFIGDIPDDLQVNHIDENKENNHVGNLNLMTSKENINWGTHNERVSKQLRNGITSKMVYQYTQDGKLVKVWESTKECGRNGFDQSRIAELCRGSKRRKTHKGYIWKYAD